MLIDEMVGVAPSRAPETEFPVAPGVWAARPGICHRAAGSAAAVAITDSRQMTAMALADALSPPDYLLKD